MAPLTCEHCGGDLKADAVYCRACGQRVGEAAHAVPHRTEPAPDSTSGAGAEHTVCPEETCGARLQPGWTKCEYCGAPLKGSDDHPELCLLRFPWGEVTVERGDVLDIGRGIGPLTAQLASYDTVSTNHVRVEFRDDGLFVTDLGSLNGTYVDGSRIAESIPTPIRAGSRLRLASRLEVSVATAGDRSGADQ